MLFPEIINTLEQADGLKISEERLPALHELETYLATKLPTKAPINLNFICTHNSRRSQLAQAWAQAIATHYNLPITCFSGGIEVTSFNERAVRTLVNQGFNISSKDGENPLYTVRFSPDALPLKMFSKLYDDPANNAKKFAAVMTCSDADENCPVIPGTEKRLPLRYDDPKEFDNTPIEEAKYEERSLQIASELNHVFAIIRKNQP